MFFISIKLIAYINPQLYMQLENISKEQMSQRNFDKWTKYNVKITQDVFQKLQQFIPIKNPKGNHKAFRLKKNGQNNGIFTEIPARIDNILNEDAIHAFEHGDILNNPEQNINIPNRHNEEIMEGNGENERNNEEEENDNEINMN